jgi:hypothetical protein
MWFFSESLNFVPVEFSYFGVDMKLLKYMTIKKMNFGSGILLLKTLRRGLSTPLVYWFSLCPADILAKPLMA